MKNEEYMELFAKRLKELRNELKLSQYSLACKTETSETAIRHWENQERVPNAISLIKLSKFFKVSIEYLLGLED